MFIRLTQDNDIHYNYKFQYSPDGDKMWVRSGTDTFMFNMVQSNAFWRFIYNNTGMIYNIYLYKHMYFMYLVKETLYQYR